MYSTKAMMTTTEDITNRRMIINQTKGAGGAGATIIRAIQ
jgi:hypothetical protein